MISFRNRYDNLEYVSNTRAYQNWCWQNDMDITWCKIDVMCRDNADVLAKIDAVNEYSKVKLNKMFRTWLMFLDGIEVWFLTNPDYGTAIYMDSSIMSASDAKCIKLLEQILTMLAEIKPPANQNKDFDVDKWLVQVKKKYDNTIP